MKKLSKNLIVLVVIFSLCICFVTCASIFDDIVGLFTNETKISETAHIGDETYKHLDAEQKKVYEKIEIIYDALRNADIDILCDSINVSISDDDISMAKKYVDENESRKKHIKSIVSHLDYKVISMRNEGGKIFAKISYSFPSIITLVKKIMPSLILNGASSILSGKIDENTVDIILKSIDNVINSVKSETYEYEFVFEKVGNDWKLSGTNEIQKDFNKYFGSLLNS